jgi:Zn-dependent membrane protease YugP
MNPVILIVPAAALAIGPRLWVTHVLRQHNRRDEDVPVTARELARLILDGHRCDSVKVESTDVGDHYDPEARTVRLSRDKIDRRTLTALTTAAHEAAHAIQHAEGYPPFLWRRKLAGLARIVSEAGIVTLFAVPAVAAVSRQPVPTRLLATAAFAMLGTGMAAQLSALPTEIDASFRRALPTLRDGYIDEVRLRDARKILVACSLTYIASSMVTVLNIWPWLGPRPASFAMSLLPESQSSLHSGPGGRERKTNSAAAANRQPGRRRGVGGRTEVLLRRYGKPLIRGVLRHARRPSVSRKPER